MNGFLVIGALVLLLVLVVWDRRRMQRSKVEPLRREELARGWSPRPLFAWPMQLGLALCTGALATQELYSPSLPPFTGRMSAVYGVANNLFGEHGVAYVWLAITLVLLLLAVASWVARTTAKTSVLPPNAL
jgi:heme exporter protein D